MIFLQQIFRTLSRAFFLVLLLTSFLIADERKTLLPAPPDTQKECDQKESKATSSDSSISSPVALSKEKPGNPYPLTPPPNKIQENTNSGG